jgi:sulfite dehydrogenase (cytochrome) subunit B
MRLASIAIMTAITAFTGISATAEEKPVRLRQAPGLDKVEVHCNACHSLDYVQMNSPFLSAAGWDAEIAKMINAFGAPIDQADAKIIADYLYKNYGSESLRAITARSAGIEPSSFEKEKSVPKPFSSNFETAREKYDTKRSWTPRVAAIRRTSDHAPFRRTSLYKQRAFCLICIPWIKPVFSTTSSRIRANARRRPFMLTRIDEFNLEGVLEHHLRVRP